MSMIADLLLKTLADRDKGTGLPMADPSMEVQPPADATGDKNIVGIDNFLVNNAVKNSPDAVTTDSGDYVGSNPFAKVLYGMTQNAPQGTMRNFVNRLLSPESMVTNPSPTGTTMGNNPEQGSIGNFLKRMFGGEQGTPGPTEGDTFTAPKADATSLSPTPMGPKQTFATPLVPPDTLPSLRNSLLVGAGQPPIDPGPPPISSEEANSLRGRMAGPYSKLDMARQGQEAVNIADEVRGFNGSKRAAAAKQKQLASTGQLSEGNINLHNRPMVKNSDGSVSTVRSITITDDSGKAILIPTVVGGRVVSNDEAIAHYKKTGENLGTFRDEASANAYAEKLHNEQAREYGLE